MLKASKTVQQEECDLTTFIFGSFRINYHTNMVKEYRNVYSFFYPNPRCISVMCGGLSLSLGRDTRMAGAWCIEAWSGQRSDFILQPVTLYLGAPGEKFSARSLTSHEARVLFHTWTQLHSIYLSFVQFCRVLKHNFRELVLSSQPVVQSVFNRLALGRPALSQVKKFISIQFDDF